VEWVNELPAKHFLPIDHSLHGAEAGLPEVRGVVHLHGAKAPPASDGYPEDWYAPGKSAVCYYPNRQDAAMLWYHDHTMGINRLNTYAGLFGAFIVRDAFEDALQAFQSGPFEIPLVICDRLLRKDGQLDYPVSDVAGAPWVPEVFGNAFLVNGKLFPYLDVEPRKYRLRLLNACNGRFLHLVFSRWAGVSSDRHGSGSAARSRSAEKPASGARRTGRSDRGLHGPARQANNSEQRLRARDAVPRGPERGDRTPVRCPRHCGRFPGFPKPRQ
jgi:FtsP/CotA-like multicopper oxidase with cupredoxin domain